MALLVVAMSVALTAGCTSQAQRAVGQSSAADAARSFLVCGLRRLAFDVWNDTDVEGLLTAFPYLKQFGVSDQQLTYKFDFDGARFIFLWTGSYDYRAPTSWDATRPTYEKQMKQLQEWLDGAKAAMLVDVQPGGKTKFTLNRFRPWSAEPFASVELYKNEGHAVP
jgi:hypothetical protein